MLYTVNGDAAEERLEWFRQGLQATMEEKGDNFTADGGDLDLVLNFIDPMDPEPYRRHGQGTYVVSVAADDEQPDDIFASAYPLLVRALSNLIIYVVDDSERLTAHFITPERGHYAVNGTVGEDAHSDGFFERVYERMFPLASSRLVIDNRFDRDLPAELAGGNERTRALAAAGKKLDEMELLPAPFPIEEVLSDRDLRHLRRLFGIGGLSYGNLSVREDDRHFWMSASGIDKSQMETIGRDILFVRDYDEEDNVIVLSVPDDVKPRRVSVDAIEHWMIYRQHPEVGAIIHVHAWMDGVASTEMNYPCGTYELARDVSDIVEDSSDPSRAVVGLKNHGLTITGRDLDDIFDRIEGRIIPQVPMS